MIKKSGQTIIVCPPSKKQTAIEIENSLGKLQKIKIMSSSEIKDNLFFSFTKKTIIYLCEKYGYTTSFAKNLISFMYYIEIEKDYNDKKINNLRELKKELLKENLIKENYLFRKYLESVRVVFRYFDYMTSDDTWLFNELSKLTQVNNESISTLEYKRVHSIYEFDTLEKECIYLFDSFANLLDQGISYENIILLNVTEASLFTLNRLSKFYNIAIDLPKNTKLGSTKIANDFIDLLNNNDIETSLVKLKEKYYNHHMGIAIYNSILNIINSYCELGDYDKYKKYIIEDINNASLPKKQISNAIKVKDFKSYSYKDGDHVFIMNANYNVFPKIYKDEDYLNDKQKEKIGMVTSTKRNEEEIQLILTATSKMNFPTITYHLATPFENAYPPFLKNINGVTTYINPIVSASNSYSKIKDIYELIEKKENKVFDERYTHLSKNLNKEIVKFNPSYNGISKNKIIKFYQKEKNGLRLSYTNMNTYYQCKYRFYINDILKLNKFEDTFAKNIGNIFHYVLSNIYKPDFNFDDCLATALSKYEFDEKESFLLTKLKEEISFVVKIILEHYNNATQFKKQFFEKEIIINYQNDDVPLSFKGIIDKAMIYEDENNKYMAIVDYKTGKAELDLEQMEFGVGLQLPVYLYLAHNSKEFKDYKFAGFYIQKILSDEIKSSPGKTRNDLRKNSLKLTGYTLKDPFVASKLDNTFNKAQYISSLNYSARNNAFDKRNRVLEEEKINDLVDLVKEKIATAFANILKANFKIEPLKINDENIGCKYCEFKDICYKEYIEEVKIDGYKLD